MAEKITDDDLIVAINKEIANSVGYSNGKLSEMRRKAEYYYLGEAKGDLAPPEVEGRSSVVSTDVADTIEWMLPQLLKIFTASDNAVEFAARVQKDEQAAKQATEYINYVFHKQNDGFNILYTWFKDALQYKNGILKVYWDDKKDVTKEDYEGLTTGELTMLLEDQAIEPIKHSQYIDPAQEEAYAAAMQQYAGMQANAQQAAMMGQQVQPLPPPPQAPMLHDVTVQRTQDCSKVTVENVPPEEFRISRSAKSIKDASFVAHVVLKTLSDLKASGYKGVDKLSSDTHADLNGEATERATYDDEMVAGDDSHEVGDETQRRVTVIESYMRMDHDGDGIAEWRKVVTCGNTVLDNEECDGPPFVSITPIPRQHRFFGRSIADLAMPTQRTKTAIKRALLDNLYLQVNGRYFAVEGQVNLDDLLTSRPGGVVRIKTQGAVGALQQGMGDAGAMYQALEYEEVEKENRTGFTRYSQGTSADSLNDTATGMNIITNRSDARTELIARVFAETGVKDLFLLILKLVSQYQQGESAMHTNGQWVTVNPREWATQFDFNVNVGLGTGNKDQVIQHLMALMQTQGNGLQLGIATPQNLYNAATKIAENMGFKQADMYFTDPSKQQPQQPQPDPRVIEAQEKLKLERERLQAEIDLNRDKAMAEIALKRLDMAFKYAVAPEAVDQMYTQAYQQTEGIANGTTPGSQPGPAGNGTVGASPVQGGGGYAPQPLPGGMGIGAGQG